MELPRIGRSEQGRFEGLKSRLGFSSAPKSDDYGDGYDEDYVEDYQDYSEYGEAYDEEYGTTGGQSMGYSGQNGSARPTPHLVSYEEVRASTRLPERLNRDPLPERRVSSSQAAPSGAASSSYRQNGNGYPRQVERASDYMISTETSDLPSDREPRRAAGSGYDALFTSNTPAPQSPAYMAASARPQRKAFDPFETYTGVGATTHKPSRSLSILRPNSYSEVERVAKIIRAGDVVVLCLRDAPVHLARRILDFSFGVSSALDASVDCIADKVFVIVNGRALSEDEYIYLHEQGVI
ncbi:MAG: cell division protein SepF [Eggerthellaceae bacterium]|nr:cell division protein SepF [Eggerthellaceae bacterium]